MKYPILFLILFLVVWQFLVIHFEIPSYLIPKPSDLWLVFRKDPVNYLSAMKLTFLGALSGFLLSFLVGLALAYCLSRFRILDQMIAPYAVFFQTVPIVAIAPLIIIWFGTGFKSVVMVSFVVSLFPMITNGLAGFKKRDVLLEDLVDLYKLNSWQKFLKLKLPLALPFVAAGAKISAGLSVIGAIIGEFFAGYGSEDYGLGYLIIVTSGQLKSAELFVATLSATFLGMIMIFLIYLVFDVVLAKYTQT